MTAFARRALVVVLGVSFALEAALTVGGFAARDLMIAQFRLAVTDDTRFLGAIMSWMLLFVTLVCGVAWLEVRRGSDAGRRLCYLLGFWWIGIGLHLACGYGRTEHLALDTGKGVLIVALACLSFRRRLSKAG